MDYILIIGAKSDIAKAIVKLFSKNSYNFYLAARNCQELKEFAKKTMFENGNTVKCIELEILETNKHTDFYNSIKVKPLCVISTVGYLGNQKLAQIDFNETKKIIDSNFTGIISLLNIIVNDFEKKKRGTIIGLSSVAGDRGKQSNYIYGAAKSAFTVYLSGLRARTFRSNIKIITVKPGFVLTKMTQNLKLPKYLTTSTSIVANDVFNAFKSNKNIVYTSWIWRWIILAIKLIPEQIFKKMKF